MWLRMALGGGHLCHTDTFLVNTFIDISIVNANVVDPDQTPHSAVSDLDLHCYPITLFSISRLQWVNWRGKWDSVWSLSITMNTKINL